MLREIVKGSNARQLAIENTHNALPIGNEQIRPGVIYDTSLGNTLSNKRNNFCFLK